MGFLRNASMVLRGQVRVRPRPQADADEALTQQQQQALEDIARRMAEMAAAIKELEERAQTVPPAGEAASPDRAEVQVEMIDQMLSGIRGLRVALDQQRAELAEAEQRLVEAEAEAAAEAEAQEQTEGETTTSA